MPDIKVGLRFKEMREISHSAHYLKWVPEVYHDNLVFDWNSHDYEFTQRDSKFVKELNT